MSSPFNAWCPLKGHTYLNKLKVVDLFKYVWPFSEHQALKGWQWNFRVTELKENLEYIDSSVRQTNTL